MSDGLSYETTKQLAALRQTKAAIEHMHKKQYECAITLAGAAEGQIKEPAVAHLFRLLRKAITSDELNAFIHWMKHASGADKATVTEHEAAMTIARAVHKFVAQYQASCQEFEEFSGWAVDRGYIPRPLTVDARPKK